MSDAQNERTNTQGRRRGRRSQRGKADLEPLPDHWERAPALEAIPPPAPPAAFVRPANMAAPTERMEIYCEHHTAVLPENEPMNIRTNMTTVRHLRVDQFGEATLFCDCLHNGPHEWPPTMQHLETAIELDQFLTASTNEA